MQPWDVALDLLDLVDELDVAVKSVILKCSTSRTIKRLVPWWQGESRARHGGTTIKKR